MASEFLADTLAEDPDSHRLLLANKVKNCMEAGKYSDLVIKCGPREWKVHRVIVCTQSTVFEKMCDSSFEEGVSGIIDLQDDDPELVGRLVQGLYEYQFNDSEDARDITTTEGDQSESERGAIEDTITEPPHESDRATVIEDYFDGPDLEPYPCEPEDDQAAWEAADSKMLVNAEVYALADKYDVALVKAICLQQTQKIAASFVGRVWDWGVEGFMAAVNVAWTTTPQSDQKLRNVYLDLIRKNTELQIQSCFLQFIRKCGDFGADVHILNQDILRSKEPLAAFDDWECKPNRRMRKRRALL